jgi:peroxiredoxin
VVLAAIAVGGYVTLNKREKQRPEVTFLSIKGDKIAPADLRGKVVMVNFWATSCTTCVAEMPKMVDTYNKFKGQGLEFVAVAMSYDPPDYVLNYTETRKLPFKVALDTDGDRQGLWRRRHDADHLRHRQGWQDPQALPGRAGFRHGAAQTAGGIAAWGDIAIGQARNGQPRPCWAR